MNTLPTYEQITQWTDEKLLSVIKSGENINWATQMQESKEDYEFYVETLYSERDYRAELKATQQ